MRHEVLVNAAQIDRYGALTKDFNPIHYDKKVTEALLKKTGQSNLGQGRVYPGAALLGMIEKLPPIANHYILSLKDFRFDSFLVVEEPKKIFYDIEEIRKDSSIYWHKIEIKEGERMLSHGDLFTTNMKEIFEDIAKKRDVKNFEKYSLLNSSLGEIKMDDQVIKDYCECIGMNLSDYSKKYENKVSGMLAGFFVPSKVISFAKELKDFYLYLAQNLDIFSKKLEGNVLEFYGSISPPKKGIRAELSIKSFDECVAGSKLMALKV